MQKHYYAFSLENLETGRANGGPTEKQGAMAPLAPRRIATGENMRFETQLLNHFRSDLEQENSNLEQKLL